MTTQQLKAKNNAPWIQPPFFILACNTNCPPKTEFSLFKHYLKLKGFDKELINSIIQVDGVYNGKTEKSYVIPDKVTIREILQVAEHYNQECVLFVDRNNQACLIYPSISSTQELGTWKEVSKEVAERNYSHTFFNGKYYVCHHEV